MADQAALCFPRLRQPLPGHGLLPRGRSSITLVTVLSALLLMHTLLYVKAHSFFLSLSLFMCLSGSLFFLLFIFCCLYYIIICSIICFKIKYFVAGGRGCGNQKHIIYKCTVNSNCIDKDGEISLLGVTF